MAMGKIAFLAGFVLGLAGCTEDNDTSNKVDSGINTEPAADAGAEADADLEEDFDAGQAANALGQLCTDPSECPDGYGCLKLREEATSGFCSQPCPENGESEECTDGYEGAGYPYCLLSNDETGLWYCGLLCADLPGTDGTCPDGMICLLSGDDDEDPEICST